MPTAKRATATGHRQCRQHRMDSATNATEQRYYQTRQLGGKQIVEHAVGAILTLPVRQSERQRQQPRHNGEQRDASCEVLDPVEGFDHGPDHKLRCRPRARAVEHHDDYTRQHVGRQPGHDRSTDRGQRERPRQRNQHRVGLRAAANDDQWHHTNGEDPTRPSTSGMLKTVMCPASRSGSRLRIAANSSDNADRACRNDILPGTPRS